MSIKRPSNSPEMQAKRAVAWAEATRIRQFGYAELASVAHTTLTAATYFVREWQDAGLVTCIADRKGGGARKMFEVNPEGEIVVPVTGDAIQQMWTSMRKSQGFSPLDLTGYCTMAVSVEEARSYCHALLHAGYLRVVQKASPPRKEAIYRLIKATGIVAPRVKRLRCLIDANENKILPMGEVRQ